MTVQPLRLGIIVYAKAALFTLGTTHATHRMAPPDDANDEPRRTRPAPPVPKE